MHAKIWVWFFFDCVYFVSQLTGPTYINIIGRKMAAVIDMPTPKKSTVQNMVSNWQTSSTWSIKISF